MTFRDAPETAELVYSPEHVDANTRQFSESYIIYHSSRKYTQMGSPDHFFKRMKFVAPRKKSWSEIETTSLDEFWWQYAGQIKAAETKANSLSQRRKE